MATTNARLILIGADLEEILDDHFREIVVAIPEIIDVMERYTMRIARLEAAERDAVVDEFRTHLLALLRTVFTVVVADERRLDWTA